MNICILKTFGYRYKSSNFAIQTQSSKSQNQNTMKINFKLFSISMLFAVALFATSCQNDAEGTAEGTTEESTESTMAEDNTTAQISATSSGAAADQATQMSQTQEVDPNSPTTSISFSNETFDFGSVKKGEKVEHSYTFTNTGDEPLIISNAKASCGCTVPTWPKEPIAPGETGEIPVIFDAKSPGNQTKTITVTANTTPPQTRLTIKGQVTEASDS